MAARPQGGHPERAHRGRLARGGQQRRHPGRELRHPGRPLRPPGRPPRGGAGAGRVALREEPPGPAHQGRAGAGAAPARGRAAPGADRHADPEPARGAGGPAARAGPAQGLRQRRPAGAPVPQRRQRRPPALEPARALLRAPHQGAGAAPAAGQDPGHGAHPAVERERLPPGRVRRDRLAAVAAHGPEDHGREGGRRRPRRAAGAPEQPAPAGRGRQAAQRAGLDRGLPRSRASRWWCSPSTWPPRRP